MSPGELFCHSLCTCCRVESCQQPSQAQAAPELLRAAAGPGPLSGDKGAVSGRSGAGSGMLEQCCWVSDPGQRAPSSGEGLSGLLIRRIHRVQQERG